MLHRNGYDKGKDISDAKKVIQSKWLWLMINYLMLMLESLLRLYEHREWTPKMKKPWWIGLNDEKHYELQKWTEWWQKRNPDLETFLDKWKDAEWDRLKEKDFWAVYWKELEAKWVSKEDFLKQFKEYYSYQSRDALLRNISKFRPSYWDYLKRTLTDEKEPSALSWLWDAGKVFKYIKNNLTVNWLQELERDD